MSLGRYRCMIFTNERKSRDELQAMYDRALNDEPVCTESNIRAYENYLRELRALIAEAE